MASSSNWNLDLWAQRGRQFVKYGIIGLIAFIILRFVFSSARNIYLQLNPPPPPPPTMGFGQLPKPSFPAQLANQRPQEFQLDTVGKRFPKFPESIEVYYVPGSQPDLLALDRAKRYASQLGFVFDPEKVSDRVYRWRRTNPLPATLEMDIVDQTFEMDVDWASSVNLLEKKILPDEKQAANELRTLMREVNLYRVDVATASPEITFLKALAGQTKPATSISEADFVRTDLYRAVPNGFSGITDRFQVGVIRALFSGSRDQGERVLYFSSSYLPVDWENPQTYPLQTAAEAWQQLLAGEGYVINLPASKKAVVRSARLAYYEPAEGDSYYQPVYVFEGDNQFQAIVTALSPAVFEK